MPTLQVPVAPTPVVGGVESGDCHFTNSIPGGIVATDEIIPGQPFGLNQAVCLFDLTAVPSGSTIVRAKVEVKAAETRTNTPTFGFETLRQGTDGEASIKPETITQSRDTSLICALNASGPVGMSSHNNLFDTVDDRHKLYLDGRHGYAMRFGQARTIDTTGAPDILYFKARRSSAGIGTGTCRAEVWSSGGATGVFRKEVLLATSATIAFSTIGTSDGFMAFSFTGAASIAAVPVICEIVFTPTSGAAADSYIEVCADTTNADSNTDNMLSYGNPTLQGFLERTNFIAGAKIWGAAKIFGSPTCNVVFPAFVDGTVYAIGDSSYSPDVTCDLADILQTSIDHADYAGWFCLRITSAGPAGQYHRWHSSRSATDTLTGLKGMVLTLEYSGAPAAGIDASATLYSAVSGSLRIN